MVGNLKKKISIHEHSLYKELFKLFFDGNLTVKGADVGSHERWAVLWLLFLSGLYSLALVPVFYLLKLPEVANAFVFLALAAAFIFFCCYRFSKYEAAAHLYGLVTFTGLSYMIAATGGLQSPLLLYQLIPPIGSTLLSTKKEARVWTILSLSWILFLLFDYYFSFALLSTSPPAHPMVSVVGTMSLLLYLLNIMWAYERAKATFQEVIQEKNKDLLAVNKAIEEQKKAIENQNSSILSSIQYAKKIQDAIMLHGRPLNSLFPESFIFFSPQEIVSGDFYWTDQLGSKKIVVAADCTRHGVPGAFMSLIGMYLLHSIVRESGDLSPEIILRKLRTSIHLFLNQETSSSREGINLAVCIIDDTDIRIASAKSPVYYLQQSELKVFKGDNLMVGGDLDEWREGDFSLLILPRKGVEYIYMCSDGFQDQFGGLNDKKYMKKKLKELFLRVAPFSSEIKKETITREFREWKGKNPQVDDVLVLGFSPC